MTKTRSIVGRAKNIHNARLTMEYLNERFVNISCTIEDQSHLDGGIVILCSELSISNSFTIVEATRAFLAGRGDRE